MGNFSTAVFIHNSEKKNKESYVNIFLKKMADNGYAVASQEESELSLCLAFSKKGEWITLGAMQFEGGGQENAGWVAKTIDACCIKVSVVDSDFAMLEMYNKSFEKIDFAVLGNASAYLGEDVHRGIKEFWEPLLLQGNTWEQFQEVLSRDYTFAEEGLEKVGQLLGMDMKTMDIDWELMDECSEDMSILYFKKCGEKNAPKKMTLNAAFKKIFAEALEPLGFVKMKGANHYFLRAVGDEMVQLITIRNEQPFNRGEKGFSISAGLATVYRPSLDLKEHSWCTGNWTDCLCSYYRKINPLTYTDDVWSKLYCLTYRDGSTEEMIETLKYALEMTKELVLPLFNEIKDLESGLMFLRKYGSWLNIYGEEENYGNDNPNNVYNEGLVYVKVGYRGDFMELTMSKDEYEKLAENTRLRGKNGYTESYDEYYKRKQEYALYRRQKLDEILNSPEKYEKALNELERRKKQNQEYLRLFGLEI